jgi:hypothetical protein
MIPMDKAVKESGCGIQIEVDSLRPMLVDPCSPKHAKERSLFLDTEGFAAGIRLLLEYS